jgi:hypothetical protein
MSVSWCCLPALLINDDCISGNNKKCMIVFYTAVSYMLIAVTVDLKYAGCTKFGFYMYTLYSMSLLYIQSPLICMASTLKIAHTSAKSPINLLNAAANVLTIHSMKCAAWIRNKTCLQKQNGWWGCNELTGWKQKREQKAFLTIFKLISITENRSCNFRSTIYTYV